ncbi:MULTISPECIES: TlpA disulfide reductase family protein [unclassified Arcicella]|uniref:TlpA family protein disulfide reductase n=1 Tax=unclassified Arcicella TaxID=2644986 RepID=UPI00286294D8|nr:MULTISPECIES: TlpA disulfide reductase family protein [unclassified Arcicella]MDR6562011.1 thiol-disulfide isomerase/thioredoxin [Arcicella sp. BE51]MDR6811883.1 thiol-disulfide isomerase/thioredoxin [Arcicella sp. BE140]MDR6822913.1 thiol-disulfide isomerase/thioredoxin [Arcicella sp. BE139]
MKRIAIFISIFIICSCQAKHDNLIPNTDVKLISSDFTKWWTYYNSDTQLSSDFTAYDEASHKIDKLTFLTKLTEGKHIPVRLKAENPSDEVRFQLFNINSSSDDISNTIKNIASTELAYFKLEGSAFPSYDFISLDNKKVSSKSNKGKYVIVKTWFLRCTACIREFPLLNNLTKQYANRDDISFISFAYDDNKKLKTFLATKPLNYSNVKVPQEYIEDTLGFNIYPTHIIIDKYGKIVRIFNQADKMEAFLQKYLTKQHLLNSLNDDLK